MEFKISTIGFNPDESTQARADELASTIEKSLQGDQTTSAHGILEMGRAVDSAQHEFWFVDITLTFDDRHVHANVEAKNLHDAIDRVTKKTLELMQKDQRIARRLTRWGQRYIRNALKKTP